MNKEHVYVLFLFCRETTLGYLYKIVSLHRLLCNLVSKSF